jgi:hypothetical protein
LPIKTRPIIRFECVIVKYLFIGDNSLFINDLQDTLLEAACMPFICNTYVEIAVSPLFATLTETGGIIRLTP